MSDPEVKDLAEEIQSNPRAFAIRFAELLADVSDMKTQMRKGVWLALGTLVGIVVDLALRLAPTTATAPAAMADAVRHLFG